MIGKKAITIKEISGACIPTIPVGTTFEILAVVKTDKRNYAYSTCKGLPISSVWNDEYILLDMEQENDN
jgi:hypothetical protein